MSWFRNLKIRNKLINSIIIIALITAVIGAISIYSLSKINKSATSMYNDNFVPSLALSEIRTELQLVRVNHLLALYERNPQTLDEKLTEIQNHVNKTNSLLDQYKKSIRSDSEQSLLDNLLNSLASYREVRNADIELISQEKYAEAEALNKKVGEARTSVDDNVSKLINFNTKIAENQLKENQKSFNFQTTIMIILIVMGVVLALVLGLFVANLISKPLSELVNAANKVASGDLDVHMEVHSKDEVGILVQAFRKMTDNMNEVLSNIYSASEQVSSGAKQVSDSSMELSQGATEQASSIEQLTASIEEISSQTTNNAENASKANELAELAKKGAELGNDRMAEMLTSMEDINEASSNISKIIKVIDDIAFQTNILALNAAVEAARAGQHGKGFAVVAEEVRNLAARSADAAKETTALIEGSIKKVESGTKIATETADALTHIVDGVEKVAVLINDITIASNEQASGISQINQGIVQVSQVIQTNSATSEESAAASEELSSQAELLKEMVRKFKLKKQVRNFSHSEDINPEILKMIDQMGERERISAFSEAKGQVAASKNFANVSDHEFGKY